MHSRIDETIDFITSRAHVGNIYVNRNIVGAVVGVQPFGGEGKSGTGPKAGGPLYLKRLQKAHRRCCSMSARPRLASIRCSNGRVPTATSAWSRWPNNTCAPRCSAPRSACRVRPANATRSRSRRAAR
ncbi:aldehyde dehydrogenase family protein [Massilia sp. B-10]|nr:aldehyde dehydrogenase family protein [Massilia sp. B-10]